MSGILQTLIASIGGAITDTYFNLVTLLLPGNGTNGAQNNTFLDSSTNNFTITRNGNTTQGTFSPFSQTGWSGNFNTSTTYLTVTDTANLRFGSSNFTIEAWVYRAASGAVQTIASKGASTPTGWVFQISAADKLVFTDTSTSITGATTLNANTWYYVAVVRAGTGTNQTTLYVNAASDATGTSSTNFNQTNNMLIGADRSTANFANGYISNLRLSNTNRTISSTPTSALTADANTIFLALNSNWFQYTDSTAAYTAMAVTGTPSVQAFSPFAPTAAYDAATVGGSGYFDGTGDSLVSGTVGAATGTGDWSIECFVYQIASAGIITYVQVSSASNNIYLQTDSGAARYISDSGFGPLSGGTARPNSWVHLVGTRQSGTVRLFVNGVLVANQASVTTNFPNVTTINLAPAAAAYMSGTRVCIGSVPTAYQTSSTTNGTSIFTPPTATLTTTSQGATSGDVKYLVNFTNAGITDATAKNVLETVGNAQISTTQSKFGGSSMYFDGTGDWLTVIDNPNLQMGSGDFTIEGWFYLSATGVAYGIVSKGTSTTGWSVNITSGNKLQFSYTSSNLTGATTLSSATWYYFAVVRSGTATGNLKIYLNGSADATSAGAVTDNFNQTSIMYVGADRVGTSALNGYIDDLRITKGYARTIATPSSAFPLQ